MNQIRCSRCNYICPADSRFCPKCGLSLVQQTQQVAVQQTQVDQSAGKLVQVDPDSSITINVKNSAEAKLALSELKLHKKTFNLQKKQINENMRQIRAAYTNQVRQQGSKVRGRGFINKFARDIQSISRDNDRRNLANSLSPYEAQKQRIELILSKIEEAILRIEIYIHQNQ